MERPPIKNFILSGILLILFSMSLVVIVYPSVPWQIMGLVTIVVLFSIGLIFLLKYYFYEQISSINKTTWNILYIIIGLLLISYGVFYSFFRGFSIKILFNLIAGIALLINGLRKRDATKEENPSWKLIKNYLPILIIIFLIVFIKINSNNTQKSDVLSDDSKQVILNIKEISNNSIYKETKCTKYIPVYKTNYSEAINYINQLFFEIGLNNSNIFNIERIEKGYGILFITSVPSEKNFQDYCKQISLKFPVDNFIECRVVRKNETTLLLTTSFRVIDNYLEARYLALSCQHNIQNISLNNSTNN
jgi:hypothetical protein